MKQMQRLVIAIVGGLIAGWVLYRLIGIHLLPPALEFPLCIIAAWFVLNRLRPPLAKPAKPDSRPTAPLSLSNEDGGWTVITARSSPLPKRGYIASVLAPAVPSMVLMAQDQVVMGLIIWLGVSSGLIALMNFGNRRKRKANLEPFAVRHDAIRLPDGQVITTDRLYRFGIRNTQTGGVIFYNAQSGLSTLSAASAMSTHQRMLPISHAVVAEHDGTMTYLAGGLSEELANAVLHEIVRRVDGFAIGRD